MATIDPAGAASSALYTPAVPVQTTPTQAAAVTERPVVESNQTQNPTDTVTQGSAGGSGLGSIIDTTA